ncbi:MAG TPA: hypothetical protein VMZ29_01235 [Candidatus Bathyarchaeia archaeon]|nr:hypothetical protein [Candidatus Bathyarchaeia archaeon]
MFKKYGNQVAEPKVTIHPLDFAKSDVFWTLTLILRKIRNERPKIYQGFKEKVSNILLQEIKQDYFDEQNDKLDRELVQYDKLSEESKFVKLHLSFIIEKLGITPEDLWANKKTAFLTTDFIPSSFGLFFIQVSALIFLLGREEALQFFREFLDAYNEEVNAIYQKNRFKELVDFSIEQANWLPVNPYGRHQIINDGTNGQFLKLCVTCEKYNSMIQTKYGQDKEILYTIMCYMHKPLAKVWNDHFILDLEQSLALGDKYCSYIYYDTREKRKTKSFTKEFLDKIWLKYK